MPSDDLRRAFDAGRFRALGERGVARLAASLERASRGDAMPVLPWADPEELLARWPGDFPERPAADLVSAFDALLARTLEASNHLHHPRYVGHQVTSPHPLAALCELASALLNNGMAVYEMGPVATVMERRVLAWLAARLGFGPAADGVLTSGGSAGNLTALLAARQAKAGFDVWREGAHAGPPLAVLVSEQAHYSVRRALQIMGLGAGGAVSVPCDARFRLRPEALPAARARAEAAGRRVFAVVASAASTATGAFDPLGAAADFCAAHDLWLHVDGAHGACATLSPATRGCVEGIERADSVVWDPHKMMLAPALATAVLFREGSRSYAAFAQDASYLFTPGPAAAEAPAPGSGTGPAEAPAPGPGTGPAEAPAPWWDIGLRTLECTKRMIAFELYASLSLLGTRLFADYVEGCFALAARFAERLRGAPDFELAVPPECNIVCFRHRPPGLAGAALDAHQTSVRERLVRSGGFYLVQTRLPAGVFLRTTLVNPFTSDEDLAALLEAVRTAA